jgi:hypothetical protein
LVEERVDGRGHEFDVSDLLRCYAGHQLVERAELLFGFHGDGLVQIVVQGRHLAEASPEQFLHSRRRRGVELGGCRQLDAKLVDA